MEKTARTDLKFYGRRKGKAIRPNRQSAYNLVMPWAEIKIPDSPAHLSPADFFDFPVDDVWLEIGFGNGEQLIHQALQNPKIGMIGCEPFMNGVAALCRDIKANNIKNIRIWQDDARLLMPRSYVRLSAGRTGMSDAVQALCFLAGANSIFYGEKLLTTPNPGETHDQALFARLGLTPENAPA